MVIDLPDGAGITGKLYLQGIIQDSGSAGSKPGSATNGVTVAFY